MSKPRPIAPTPQPPVPVTEQIGWQLLQTHLALTSQFSIVVLIAPDEWTLDQVRLAIPALVPEGRSTRYIDFDPLFASSHLVETLIASHEASKADFLTWLSVPSPDAPPSEPIHGPWREAFVYLNRHRNHLPKQMQGTLVVAGTPATLVTLREYAPDFWSVRSALISFDKAPITGDYANHPSQQRARISAYRRALLKAFSRYEELALDHFSAADTTAPDIWDIFVHPACSERHLRPEDIDEDEQGLRADPDHYQRKHQTQELLQLISQDSHRRTVLLADPGMGKSTLIQALIAHLASGRPFVGAPALNGLLPIPFILRDIVPLLDQDNVESWTWETLVRALLTQYRREENAPPLLEAFREHPDEFLTLLKTNPNLFILVDGLDEIGDLQKRRKVVECIHEGMLAVPAEARWLITSRVIGYRDAQCHVAVLREKLVLPKTKNRRELGLVVIQEQDRLLDILFDKWKDRLPRGFVDGNSKRLDFQGDYEDRDLKSILEKMQSGAETTIAAHFPIAYGYYLAPFNDQRQDLFTQRWFKHRHGTDHSKELLREVRKRGHDGVRIISRVPNLLCMMNMLKRSGKPLPDGRFALYETIGNVYLGDLDRVYRTLNQMGHDCPFSTPQRWQMLGLIAMHMQQQRLGEHNPKSQIQNPKSEGQITISLSDLHDLLEPWVADLQQRGLFSDKREARIVLDELLSHIARRSGLLIPRGVDQAGQDLFAFTHLSFLEFFAACHLRDQLNYQAEMDLAEFRSRRHWTDQEKADYQKRYPRSPFPARPSDLPDLAKQHLWHEILILLLEAHSGSQHQQQRDALLHDLFPTLHSPDPLPIEEDKPPLPYACVELLVKLAWDKDLALTQDIRRPWWEKLWLARLTCRLEEWRGSNDEGWHIAPKLLERPEGLDEGIDALASALKEVKKSGNQAFTGALYLRGCIQLTSPALARLPRLDEITDLSLSNCTGLTDTAPLAQCNNLDHLWLIGCTGLKGKEALAGIVELKSLGLLGLQGCTGLSQEDVDWFNEHKKSQCRVFFPKQ
ncbi:MAG: NACHT domain-containing protein [Verrucomicrobiaceae bacterium]|nr:NACHT domain-containing protein [Verrucomicrobiaceae bacterium]